MSDNSMSEFSTWRKYVWPIHAYELKKLLPMFLMMFFISFNYTILRDTKDSLIVTAPGSGAEAIPFLKVWGVLPGAIIFMLIYAKMANSLSRQALFFASIAPFVAFFAIFPILIYPNISHIHPVESAQWLESVLPAGFKGLIAIYRNWSYSLFYIMSELWGSVALSLLFWGFANQITRVSEAKRFYVVFGLGANVALPFSGWLITYFSKVRDTIAPGVDPWGLTLNRLMTLVVIAGILVMALYYYINYVVLTDPRFAPKEGEVKKKKAKMKMSLKDSLLYLTRSRYITCLAMLVIAYGIAINIYEVTWKSQLKLQYPSPNEYSAFMGLYSQTMGFVSILMMLFVGGNVMRNLGWGFAASLTPVVLLITGSLFFSFVIFRDSLGGFISSFGTTPLFMAVIIGTIQNVLSKSSKYSLFDPTKEMAYIPLDEETKVKGKAVVDVVGARFGKSGGALIQQALLVYFGSLAAITPYLAVICLLIGVVWLFAVKVLNKDFLDLSEQRRREAEEQEA